MCNNLNCQILKVKLIDNNYDRKIKCTLKSFYIKSRSSKVEVHYINSATADLAELINHVS